MAQIGTIKISTANNGVVSLPVYEIGDSKAYINEAFRVQTSSGTGFVPVTSLSSASAPYLQGVGGSGTKSFNNKNYIARDSSIVVVKQDTAYIRNFSDGSLETTIDHPNGDDGDEWFSPQLNNEYLTLQDYNGTMWVYSMDDYSLVEKITGLDTKHHDIYDGYLAYADTDQNVKVVESDNFDVVQTYSYSKNPKEMKFGDGYLAVAVRDLGVDVYDLSDFSRVHRKTTTTYGADSTAVTENYFLYSCNLVHKLYKYDMSDGSQIAVQEYGDDCRYCDANDEYYMVELYEGTVRVYDGTDAELYKHSLPGTQDAGDVVMGKTAYAYGSSTASDKEYYAYVHDISDGSLIYEFTDEPQKATRVGLNRYQ